MLYRYLRGKTVAKDKEIAPNVDKLKVKILNYNDNVEKIGTNSILKP